MSAKKILQFPSQPRENVLKSRIKRSPAAMRFVLVYLAGEPDETMEAFKKLNAEELTFLKAFIAETR